MCACAWWHMWLCMYIHVQCMCMYVCVHGLVVYVIHNIYVCIMYVRIWIYVHVCVHVHV